jgi:regulator of cell morphogenesis and NO signaling
VRQLTHNLSAPAHGSAAWHTLYARLSRLEMALLEHIALENTVLFPRALNDE